MFCLAPSHLGRSSGICPPGGSPRMYQHPPCGPLFIQAVGTHAGLLQSGPISGGDCRSRAARPGGRLPPPSHQARSSDAVPLGRFTQRRALERGSRGAGGRFGVGAHPRRRDVEVGRVSAARAHLIVRRPRPRCAPPCAPRPPRARARPLGASSRSSFFVTFAPMVHRYRSSNWSRTHRWMRDVFPTTASPTRQTLGLRKRGGCPGSLPLQGTIWPYAY